MTNGLMCYCLCSRTDVNDTRKCVPGAEGKIRIFPRLLNVSIPLECLELENVRIARLQDPGRYGDRSLRGADHKCAYIHFGHFATTMRGLRPVGKT